MLNIPNKIADLQYSNKSNNVNNTNCVILVVKNMYSMQNIICFVYVEISSCTMHNTYVHSCKLWLTTLLFRKKAIQPHSFKLLWVSGFKKFKEVLNLIFF